MPELFLVFSQTLLAVQDALWPQLNFNLLVLLLLVCAGPVPHA
jgi:hypothetical protein